MRNKKSRVIRIHDTDSFIRAGEVERVSENGHVVCKKAVASLTLGIHQSSETCLQITFHFTPADPSFNKPSSSDKVPVSQKLAGKPTN